MIEAPISLISEWRFFETRLDSIPDGFNGFGFGGGVA
ncbi:hypothetical protein BGS_1049 [Beggiatoa sp. SS]|nr:hypothetical protein BGS_1049 [Beggiatoa sp. SS]